MIANDMEMKKLYFIKFIYCSSIVCVLLIKERKGKIIPDTGDHVFHAACMKCPFVCLFLVFHVVFKFFFTCALLFHSLLNFYALIRAHCSELSFSLPL